MKQAISFLFTPSYQSLSIIFSFIGSCLIFIPPIIPEQSLQSFGEAIFAYTQPGAAAVFINAFQSLGIEFYGGAILSYAFGVIEEKGERNREEQDDKQNKILLSRIELLNSKVNELTQLISKETAKPVNDSKKGSSEPKKSATKRRKTTK